MRQWQAAIKEPDLQDPIDHEGNGNGRKLRQCDGAEGFLPYAQVHREPSDRRSWVVQIFTAITRTASPGLARAPAPGPARAHRGMPGVLAGSGRDVRPVTGCQLPAGRKWRWICRA